MLIALYLSLGRRAAANSSSQVCKLSLLATVHRCTWLAGAPKAQHSALPSQGQIPAPGMAAMGPVSSSYFWQDVQGGPGEAKGQLLAL